MKVCQRRELAQWAQAAYEISGRRASRLLMIERSSYLYKPTRDPQGELVMRLRDLAATHVRYGYRRLTVMLRREGWKVNSKRVYRLYRIEGLYVISKVRRRIERVQRLPSPQATKPNQRWSMDFVSVRLRDKKVARILTVVDQFTRECLGLFAGYRMSGRMVAEALDIIQGDRGAKPESITVDNGSEFASRAMSDWAMEQQVRLDFIRPGKPVENAYIESFNGRLRDECLNINGFRHLEDLKKKLDAFREHYNQHRPHSSLNDESPNEFAARHPEQKGMCFALKQNRYASTPTCKGPAVNGLTVALDKPSRMRKLDLYKGEAQPATPNATRDSLKTLWRKFQARQTGLGRKSP